MFAECKWLSSYIVVFYTNHTHLSAFYPTLTLMSASGSASCPRTLRDEAVRDRPANHAVSRWPALPSEPQLCYSTNIINVHQLREEVCRDTRRIHHILLLNSLTLWLLDSSPYPHNSACKNVQGSSRLISFFPLFAWCITRLEPLASSLCVYLGETSSLGTAQI